MMKMKPDHYAALAKAIGETLARFPDVRTQYATNGLSNMRLNWDLLYASKIDGARACDWVCRELYSYLNDTHINTALKTIVGNDGLSSKGQR